MGSIGAFARGLAVLAALAGTSAPSLGQDAAPGRVPASPGDPREMAPRAAVQPRVFIFRGFADVFSIGMNDLTLRLFDLGYDTVLASHREWQSVAARALAEYRADPQRVRIAIIGHSLGANASIAMAAWLGTQGVPVALLVTYDPTFAGMVVSRNVGRAINFYSGGTLGFALASRPEAPVENVDRTELSHVAIAKAPELHAATIAALDAAFGPP